MQTYPNGMALKHMLVALLTCQFYVFWQLKSWQATQQLEQDTAHAEDISCRGDQVLLRHPKVVQPSGLEKVGVPVRRVQSASQQHMSGPMMGNRQQVLAWMMVAHEQACCQVSMPVLVQRACKGFSAEVDQCSVHA